MMKKLFLLLLIPSAAFAQERLQPGKAYNAGEVLYAPRFGFTATVPQGWSGLFPREGEVFLLSSMNLPAEIYVFARDNGDPLAMKKDWTAGFDMDENIKLKGANPVIKDGLLSSEVVAVGPNVNKSYKAYAAARCGGQGPCVSCLATMQPRDYEAVKKVVDQFITSAKFDKPSTASPYEKFDWKKFVAGKMFTTYAYQEKGSKETKIDLCPDGSFKAKVSKKGLMKNQNPQYQGSLSGTWTAEGIGEYGTLLLEFPKLPPLEVQLYVKDEKFYTNGERYFVAASEKCKK